MQNTKLAPTDFEREKWQNELDLRKRELALKEKEQATPAWRSPLTIAIIAAAVAAAGNAGVAWLNGSLQRDLESNKRDAEIRLERSKAESDRILEMIRTDDTEKAAGNLDFLLRAGLVTDPEVTARLRAFLAQRSPGSGPSLPASSPRIEFQQSDLLPASLQKDLEDTFDRYGKYLDGIRFPDPQAKAKIKLAANLPGWAYYDGADHTMVIDVRVADDPYVALREYNHHILTSSQASASLNISGRGLESGLADYFAASFLDTPSLGEKAAKIVGGGEPYIVTLKQDKSFRELPTPRDPSDQGYVRLAGVIWGGAFWEIREKLGRDVADSMIASAWLNFEVPEQDGRTAAAFVSELLTQAEAKEPASVATVRSILMKREFPVPPTDNSSAGSN